MNSIPDLVCWHCGARLADEPLPLSRHANCARCFTELHACRMCEHYDPDAVDRCQEDRAEPPTNKEGANFCEYLKPRGGAFGGAQSQQRSKADAARAELDALFAKPEGD